MRVMIIITLVFTSVNLFNISCVNISYRKTFLFLMRMGTISPPIKTYTAVVSLFLLVKKQCLTPGITFNVALIHPMESCVFFHRGDHSLISNGEERNSKTTSDPFCEMCCQNMGGMWMLKPHCVPTSLCLRLYSPREWIHKAVNLRETQGDTGRYKEMKRGKTHTEIKRDRSKEKEIFFLIYSGLRILQRPKQTKTCAFNLTVSKWEDNHRGLKVSWKPDLLVQNKNYALKCSGIQLHCDGQSVKSRVTESSSCTVLSKKFNIFT